MRDRSEDPSRRATQREIERILAEALQEARRTKLQVVSSSNTPAPYVKWLVLGLMLAIASAWPVDISQLVRAVLFIGACICGLVALILPWQPRKHASVKSRKSAKLHRVS